ncbi:MAG: DUF2207 domain-containing protein [Muribaculaceae bacterium]|nr:DUF2207 domain-containing protein [Muribaculaceae bacterium]
MKKYFISLLLLAITAIAARADEGGYTLPYVMVDATVHENNTWEVMEGLMVDFSEPRHGIYKYIPSKFFYGFTMPDGKRKEFVYKNTINVLDVKDRLYSVEEDETKAENTIIQIGDPDKTVKGRQSYIIEYDIKYFHDRFDGEDFLCHTVWGSGWNTLVDTLDFEIKFDKPFPKGFAQALHIYSGHRGATTNDDSVAINVDEKNHKISGRVFNLPAGHAITLSAKLPEGYWNIPPKDFDPIKRNILTLCVVTAIFLLVIFLRRGRKPVEVVSFYPPNGISSAMVGKIIDDTTDTIDMASLIPWFAHRGFIKITEIRNKDDKTDSNVDLKLEKKTPLMPDAPDYQQKFMHAIFDDKKSVKLSELGDRHVEMAAAFKALDNEFTGRTKLTSTSKWAIFLWVLMLFITAMIAGACSLMTDFSEDDAMVALFTGCVPPFFVGLTRLLTAAKLSFQGNYFRTSGIIATVVSSALGGALFWYLTDMDTMCFPVYVFLILFIVMGLLSYLVNFVVSDTDYRVSLLGELKGLRRFIETAEQQRLKALVDDDPSYFYDILPFAIVMGLSDKWVEQFANIRIDNPDWYSSSSHSFHSMTAPMVASTIARSVSTSIASAVQAASVDPTSSSSSGGYSGGGSSFSGGGGGGGGGGSW